MSFRKGGSVRNETFVGGGGGSATKTGKDNRTLTIILEAFEEEDHKTVIKDILTNEECPVTTLVSFNRILTEKNGFLFEEGKAEDPPSTSRRGYLEKGVSGSVYGPVLWSQGPKRNILKIATFSNSIMMCREIIIAQYVNSSLCRVVSSIVDEEVVEECKQFSVGFSRSGIKSLFYPYESWSLMDMKDNQQMSDQDLLGLMKTPRSNRKLDEIAFSLMIKIHQLHQAGIIHNDLKPENIFVIDNNPYLIDFGFSTLTDYPHCKEIAGTAPYSLCFLQDEMIRNYLCEKNFIKCQHSDRYSYLLICVLMFVVESDKYSSIWIKYEKELKRVSGNIKRSEELVDKLVIFFNFMTYRSTLFSPFGGTWLEYWDKPKMLEQIFLNTMKPDEEK